LIEQVRILKKFLKTIGVYGSQIAISGFSGYVTEVLTIKFKSFLEVLNFIANISTDTITISLNYEIPNNTFDSKLVIIDPIDEKRNLGAAISPESLAKFILTARNFLDRPSIKYFMDDTSKFNIEGLKKNLLIVEFKVIKRSPDILWGQLKRKLTAIAKQLSLRHFDVIKYYCYTNEEDSAIFFFLLRSPVPWATELKKGPEIFRRDDTNAFLGKRSHDSILFWIDNRMNIFSINEAPSMTASECIREILEDDIRGNAKGVSADLASGFEVYMGNDRELSNFVLTAFNVLNKGYDKIFRFQ
jgi:tRNA nucleotidyltransferase (CCA-adding enzyme)